MLSELADSFAEKEAAAQHVHEKETAQKQIDSASGLPGWSNEELSGLKVYHCSSCGAELVVDDATAASKCPYCNNPIVFAGQLDGVMRPDLIIPFRLSKDDAIASLKKFYQGKRLLPKLFSRDNHLQEIKGLYVPFWLFDCRSEGHMRFNCTKVRSYRSGKYEVTDTAHFDVSRGGFQDFAMIPSDGSSKMPDDFMDSIEPFDYSELKEFSTSYLPGFFADKYDVDSDACFKHVKERAARTLEEELQNSVVGYSSVITSDRDIHVSESKLHYALLPVWVLCTKWNNKDFLFTINGQTGLLSGELPVDKGRAVRFFLLLFLCIFAGITAITLILGFM